jgi:hypothetical protein
MRQGDGGRFVQRLGGREIRLEKLDKLREMTEMAIKALRDDGRGMFACLLQAALDDAFPPPKEVIE